MIHATHALTTRRRRWAVVGTFLLVIGMTGGLVLTAGQDEPAFRTSTVGGEENPVPTDPIPPSTNVEATTWSVIPPAPIPPRVHHTAVWTGRALLVWGGIRDLPDGELQERNDGAAYDPGTGIWRILAESPLRWRSRHSAFWTGTHMLVWGGISETDNFTDGALYDPAADAWRPISAFPLAPRTEPAVAWADARLVVWGGRNVYRPNEVFDDGAAYDPATDTWETMPGAPIGPRTMTAVASLGSQVLIWGGVRPRQGEQHDGAIFDVDGWEWRSISRAPNQTWCQYAACTGTWTGGEAIFLNERLAYQPSADRWRAIPEYPAAVPLTIGQSVVWANDRLIAWGGNGAEGRNPDGVYVPNDDTWSDLEDAPGGARAGHSAVWTGTEMLIWGGRSGSSGTGATTQHSDGLRFRASN